MMLLPHITFLAHLAVLAPVAPTLPDLDALTDTQKQAFLTVTRAEFCSCNSPYTLAGCNDTGVHCPIAAKLNTTIVKAVQQGMSANAVLSFLAAEVTGPFCDPPIELNTSGAPSQGPPQAPVTVVEFADFRCAHCREAYARVHAAVQAHARVVKFYFVPYPIQDHPMSYAAAEALLSADAQGLAWPMYEALFTSTTTQFDTPTLVALAGHIKGLDTKRFEAELTSRRYLPLVKNFKSVGAKAGVEGTPTFFVNARRAPDAPPITSLADAIEMALAREKGDCP